MGFDTWQNKLKLTIDSSKIDEDLTNFPILVALSSGTGITNYDATDVFDQLEPNTISGVAVSGTYDDYTKLMLHMDGDFSDSQHTVTIHGNPKSYSSEGVFSGSMRFDGTGDYLQITDSSDWYLSGDFTVDMRIKFTAFTYYLVTQYEDADNRWYFVFDVGTTGLAFKWKNDGDLYEAKQGDTTGWSLNTWYHVAAVLHGSELKVYRDGITIASGTVGENPDNYNGDLYIGQRGSDEYYLNAYIDELRISKGIARWTSNFTPPTEPYTTDSGTVLLLHMDGDQSVSEHTITFNGNSQLYDIGVFDGSMYFDGSGDYLVVEGSDEFNFGTDDFTIEAWVKINLPLANFRESLCGQTDNYDNRYAVRPAQSNGNFGFTYYNGSTYRDMDGGAAITDGDWCHVAVVRASGVFKFFINGIKGTDNTSYPTESVGITDGKFYIARNNWDSYDLPCYIDELRVSKGIARWVSDFTPPTGPYGSSWDNRKKIAITTEVASPGIYDQWTKLLLHMDGDQSDSQHIITVNGSPQIYSSIGKFNGSMYFDGTGDYLNIPDSSDFDLTSVFTIDFWFKTNTSNQCCLLNTGNANNSNEYQIEMNRTSGKLSVYSSGQKCVTTSSWNDNNWHHCALVCDGTDMKMYIDGVKDGEELSYAPSWTPTGMYIGSAGGSEYYTGYIDELRISKGIARWTSNFTPPTEPYTTDSGTVLLLHMDGDQSESYHTVTFNGSPQIYSSIGKFNGSMYFDGTGDSLSIPDSNDWNFGNSDFTIDFWVYNSQAVGVYNEDYIMYFNGSSKFSWFLRRSTAGKLEVFFSSNGTSWDFNQSTSETITSNVWHHIAIVRDGNTIKPFIDGVLATFNSTTYTNSLSTAADLLRIADSGPSTDCFEGYIDELRISKGIARWTSNFTPPTEPYTTDSGTVLLLHMDGDQSESYHTVTFNGNPQLTCSGTNGSYCFDGSGDYLSVPDSSDWDFEIGHFTVDFRINFKSLSGYQGIISTAGDGEVNNGWMIYTNGTTIYFWMIPVSAISTTITTDTWYHMAITGDGTTIRAFIDGTLIGSQSAVSLSYADVGVVIGRQYTGVANYYLDAYLEEVRISKGIARWTSAFSIPTPPYQRETGELQLPVEIERWDSENKQAWLWTKIPTIVSGTDTDLYLYYDSNQTTNSGYVGDVGDIPAQNVWDSNFVGVWHMSQDPSGGLSTIKDSTSSVNDGTPAGSMTSTDLVDGKISKALDFDGSDDVITLGTITTTAWTAEIISKPINYTQSGDGFIVFDGNGIVQANGYWALLENSDCQRKGNSLSISGDFVNIVASYDGSSVYKMYENGVENSSSHVNSGWALGDKYYIAEGYSSRRPEGKIDEVRVSNTERSTAWVKSTYYSNWDNLLTFSEATFVNFIFSNPIPADASTQYGYRHLLGITVTTSGNVAPSYVNDITFYDGSNNKIGNTVSGVSSGAQSTSTDYYFTPTAGTNSWYVYSTASGYDGTSSTYSFNNLFLCAGYTEVNGVRTSGIPVRLYKRSDGSMLGEAVTSGVSGTFAIPTSYTGYHYAVALHPTDDYRNAEIYDWLAPVIS